MGDQEFAVRSTCWKQTLKGRGRIARYSREITYNREAILLAWFVGLPSIFGLVRNIGGNAVYQALVQV